MFKRILVAVGGDDASMAPALVAGKLACELAAQATVVSVKRSTSETLGDPYYSDRQVQRTGEAQSVLVHAEQIMRNAGATKVDSEWIEGRPADRIVELARDRGYDLLVLGTRGRGRMHSAILGSVSAEVAAHSGVPVLIVPES